MRHLLFCLASVAAFGAAHAATSADAPIPVALGWRVSLDAQGHVTQLQPIPDERIDRVPVIRKKLEEAIHTWNFMPGIVNGHPQPTDTALFVRAELALTNDRTTRIRIIDADVGGSIAKSAAPRYPGKAIRHHETGEVVLKVSYDAEGKPTDIEPVPDSPAKSKALIEASVTAVRSWTFQPEVVGGHALAGTSVVPICYTLNARHPSRQEDKCDWKAHGSDRALDNGEALALNPAAKLLTEVAGRTL